MRNRARGGRREGGKGRKRKKGGDGRVEEGRRGLERMGEERREERLPPLEKRSGYAPGRIGKFGEDILNYCRAYK